MDQVTKEQRVIFSKPKNHLSRRTNLDTYQNQASVSDFFFSCYFFSIPFRQGIFHNWADEYCVKILMNCRKAIPENNGKHIIVDIVLQQDGSHQFGDVDLVFDLSMFAHTNGGKERTELEWKMEDFLATKPSAYQLIIEAAYPI